ncbi:hypothetical protein GCM10010377_47270 [Streptomyces viridiviolaceus]|nr:hypothetical protein GCM10010377_47270 [Streptomyces viridiviolaceus]
MSLPLVGLAPSLLSDAFSTPQAASETVIVDAATDMAIRRMQELTSGAFRTRVPHCNPGD